MLSKGLVSLSRVAFVPAMPRAVAATMSAAVRRGPAWVYTPAMPATMASVVPAGYTSHASLSVLQPGGDIIAAAGRSATTLFGRAGKPPGLDVEVVEAPLPPKFDASGCWLLFVKALYDVVTTHADNREERARQAAGGGSRIPADPEGVAYKKSYDATREALKALQACLANGKTASEAVKELVFEEAKATVETLIKDQFDNKSAIAAFGKKAATVEATQFKIFKAMRQAEIDKLLETAGAFAAYQRSVAVTYKEWAAARRQVAALFEGMTKDYKDIIKDSDGITTLRPGVIKALEKARATEAKDDLGLAKAELEKQMVQITAIRPQTPATVKLLKELAAFVRNWLG